MLEELREIDTTAIEKLVKIKKEQDRLVGFRSKADEMKGTVDDAVYHRVQTDYDKRESTLEKEAEPLKAKAREEFEKLCSIFDRIKESLEQARKAKAELEFRHAVGELDRTQLAEKLGDPESALERSQSQLEDAEKLKAQFLEAFHSVEELEAGAKVGPEARIKIQSEAKPELNPKVEPEVKSEANLEAESKIEPEAKSEVNSKVEPEAKSGVKPEADSKIEPVAKPKLISKVEPEAKSSVKPGIDSEMEPVAKPKVKPKVELKAKSKIKPEVESRIESKLWPEGEPEGLVSEPETPIPGESTDRTFVRPISDTPDGLFVVPQAKLVTLKKGKPSEEFTLGVMNNIGRAQDNNIRIKSPTVSRKHAVVTAIASDFTLKDLGSLSGTFVNEKRVTECTLADGDRIKVGDVELVFRLL